MSGEPAMQGPLVSVVMPAYKATWLPQALESVRRQTYRPLELVVCDDSRDGRIQAIVEAFAAGAGFPVRYSRNPSRLWETRSTARAISMSAGEYIKFLHDDDVLHDGCIAALVEAFARAPQAALATVRRRLVDEAGEPLPDTVATAFPPADLLVDGHDIASFLADRTLNFPGEPSAVMCRREPLLAMGDGLSVLDGVRVTWVADLALYVKLLRSGPAAMLGAALVDFRVSPEQFSQIGRDRPGIGNPGHEALRAGIRSLGWYRGEGGSRQVAAGPLDGSAPMQRIDLVDALEQAHAARMPHWHRAEWLRVRRPAGVQAQLLDAHLAAAVPPRLGVLVVPDARAPGGAQATVHSLAANARPGLRVQARVAGAPVDAAGSIDVQPLPWDERDPAGALNAAIAGWDVEWLLVVEAGTEFTAGGLARLAVALPATRVRNRRQDWIEAIRMHLADRPASLAAGQVLRAAVRRDWMLEGPGLDTWRRAWLPD